jgi:hypothetical protein
MNATKSARPQTAGTAAMVQALSMLFEPGQVVELRAVNVSEPSYRVPHTVSGYFNDWPALAQAAAIVAPHAAAVYVTLNVINPALLARAANRARPVGKNDPTTSDGDVIARRWLLIDTDPVRPADISSSDAEKSAALAKGAAIRDCLALAGWPQPIEADSANGGHLLYRVDLAANDGGLVERVLKGLAFMFDDEMVHVDTSVHNPARITKLYGTRPHKGDDVPDRPHRMARILSAPDQLSVVTREQLAAVADWLPQAPPASTNGHRAKFDIDSWIARHLPDAIGPSPWQSGGRKWVLPVCPWNSSHTNRSAYVVEWPGGKLGAGCHHAGCQSKDWHALRDVAEPGWDANPTDGHPGGNGHTPPMPEPPPFDDDYTSPATEPAQAQPAEPQWPEPLAPEAFYGLAGDIVNAIAPHTEADPAALLINTLVAAGNAIGRGPYAPVGASRHYANLFAVLVGETAKGRKGTSWDPIRETFYRADPVWAEGKVASGLSSGEGVIWAVRDAIEKNVPVKIDGKTSGEYTREVVDEGVRDKRLLVIEAEYASVLKVMAREGNTLSPVVRLAWDSGNLRSLVKNSPAQATGAHISILGHITRIELLRHLNDTEQANGFGNRFLWVCTRRAQILPEGGGEPPYNQLVPGLHAALEAARKIGRVQRDDAARQVWAAVYTQLSEGLPGLLGAVTARAEAQVLRLSLLYALLDSSPIITVDHLSAAMAVWDYCQASAEYIFGRTLGDPVADLILEKLTKAANGLSRTDINRLFSSHVESARVAAALALLEHAGEIKLEKRETGGRAAEVWRLT